MSKSKLHQHYNSKLQIWTNIGKMMNHSHWTFTWQNTGILFERVCSRLKTLGSELEILALSSLQHKNLFFFDNWFGIQTKKKPSERQLPWYGMRTFIIYMVHVFTLMDLYLSELPSLVISTLIQGMTVKNALITNKMTVLFIAYSHTSLFISKEILTRLRTSAWLIAWTAMFCSTFVRSMLLTFKTQSLTLKQKCICHDSH